MDSITSWSIVWTTPSYNPITGEPEMINKFTTEQRDKLKRLRERQMDFVQKINHGMYTAQMRDSADGLHDIDYLTKWIDGKCDSNFREYLAMRMANKLHIFLRKRGF